MRNHAINDFKKFILLFTIIFTYPSTYLGMKLNKPYCVSMIDSDKNRKYVYDYYYVCVMSDLSFQMM